MPLFPFIPPIRALVLAVALLAPLALRATDSRDRSTSSSQQFIVYCTDAAVRTRVAAFAEEVKTGTLAFLGESGRRGFPIVLTVEKAGAGGVKQPPVTFSLLAVAGGLKIEIGVRIGENPADIFLQKHLVRAVLLEYAYREAPWAVRGGESYAEPPWWLVEGIVQSLRLAQPNANSQLFRGLLEANHIPTLEHFMEARPSGFGPAAESIEQACALCLVQLLAEQPDGRGSLRRMLRRLPEGGTPDPVATLVRDFPALGAEPGSVQKWWTLGVARFSAADRHTGLSPEETDTLLASLLHFEIPALAGAPAKSYGLEQWPEFQKLPAARAALQTAHDGVLALSTRANALYRPILAEYEEVLSLLVRGKTRGVKQRLVRAGETRESILRRTADVADYLNWFEATQTATRSESFEGYIKAANELATPVQRHDPVSAYLDEVEADGGK